VLTVQDFQRSFDTRLAQVPIVLPGEILQHADQLRDVDVVVVVEMAEPSEQAMDEKNENESTIDQKRQKKRIA
jgi:hypothetical protein